MRDIILYTHNITSVIYLALSVIIIYTSIKGVILKTDYSDRDNKITLFCIIALYLQFAFGVYLYFSTEEISFNYTNPDSNIFFRFWETEHFILMLFAIATSQLGKIIIDKKQKQIEKHKVRLLYFITGLCLILLSLFFAHFA